MLYKMKCNSCGTEWDFKHKGILRLPVNQKCPKCGRWTGEPITHKGKEERNDTYTRGNKGNTFL